MLTSEKRSAFRTFRMRFPSLQHFMILSTKTHIAHRHLGGVARICPRRCVHTLPFRHSRRSKLRMTSNTSSITGGPLSPHLHDTTPLRHQHLLGWGSSLTCPRTAGVRQRQRLLPGDGIRPVPRACSTNWIMARDRLVALSRRMVPRLMAGCQTQDPHVMATPPSSGMSATERRSS